MNEKHSFSKERKDWQQLSIELIPRFYTKEISNLLNPNIEVVHIYFNTKKKKAYLENKNSQRAFEMSKSSCKKAVSFHNSMIFPKCLEMLPKSPNLPNHGENYNVKSRRLSIQMSPPHFLKPREKNFQISSFGIPMLATLLLRWL